MGVDLSLMYSLQTFERCFYGAPFWGRGFLLPASWSFAEVLGALAFVVSAIGVWWVCVI
jgi:hypothetical protein